MSCRRFLLLSALTVAVLSIWLLSSRRQVEAAPACASTTGAARWLVSRLCYDAHAAHLALTNAGVSFCLDKPGGAEELARLVMSQPGWQGARTQQNVRDEIWSHCWVYRASFDCVWWLRDFCDWLRGRANPIDIEFFVDWPQSLGVNALQQVLPDRADT